MTTSRTSSSFVPRGGDAVIALAGFVLALTSADGLKDVFAEGRQLDLVGAALLACATLPLAWRQRIPRFVLWFTVSMWMAYVGLGYVDSTGILGPVVALYTVALYLNRREAAIHGVVTLSVMASWIGIGIVLGYPVTWHAAVQLLFLFGIPFAVGLADSRRNARLIELELDQQRRAQAERLSAADAVRAERARIARELHDVVAHELTVMALHAEGARRKAPDDVTEQALSTIAQAARSGLIEMQRVIGVLRESEQELRNEANELRGLAQTNPSPPDEDLAPTPRLGSLKQLAAQVTAAGLSTSLEFRGDNEVPAIVEVSAYRIVQEALTNAMKYAGPDATATVVVEHSRGTLKVTVEDDGRGAIMEAAQSTGGHGIAGMRERVSALGGTLEWGPRPGGGFRIRAYLPYRSPNS